MITSGFSYFAVLLFTGGCIKMMESTKRFKIFNYLPGVVALYFIVMLMATFGLWSNTESITATYKDIKGNLLPAMIFLMLLKGDLRQIAALGPRMLTAFAAATISIGIGFIVCFIVLMQWLPDGAWKAFAALCGSWMGGTGNMVAIQGALDVPDSLMGYTLLMDSIDYALWVVLLLALVIHAPAFNRWTKSNTDTIDEIGRKLEEENGKSKSVLGFTTMIFLVGAGLIASALAQNFADVMPVTSFFSHTTWTVLIVTIFGVIGAMTPLGRIAGSNEIANVMLYGIIALIASRADFGQLTQAPLFVFAGLIILTVHGLCMVAAAKLFRLDLFSCGVASLANIGGVASAPILAAAYSQALIPIGVLMSMLGYIIGTGGGLLIGKILALLS
ncbi:MAG: DUF819 domain-containing protein [Emcibacter sp.]|nr:DUF819 domain-containing protein [Emcibacter sp.]